jgi:hypothetical protein
MEGLVMMAVVVAGSISGSSKDEQILGSTIRLLKEHGVTHVAVASRFATVPQPGVGLITYSERFSLGTAISEYARSFENNRVILVPYQGSEIRDFGRALEVLTSIDTNATIAYAPVNQGSLPVEFPGMSAAGMLSEKLLQELQPGMTVPAAAMSVDIGLLLETQTTSQTLPGLALELFLEAQQRGDSLSESAPAVTVSGSPEALLPPNTDIAASVRKAIESIAIEDLFPSLPWSSSERESGTSAYHSLAAKFIRLGDLSSAETCLDRAEELHSSPRTLALRAVVAMERGETFGAIAKLIASLQEYEQGSKTPYTRISENVEHVNSELKQGLEALNAQDNTGALTHFVRAIREFDGFYKETGLLQRI